MTDAPTADTTTATVTPWLSELRAIEPGGTVVEQPSTASPARIELSLTNPLDHSVSVYPAGFGTVPLESVSPLTGETGDVLLFPPGIPMVKLMGGEFPEEPKDGCWKIVDTDESDDRDPYRASVNHPNAVEIAAGETYSVEHEAYYRGPDTACLPPGEYQTTVEVTISEATIGPRKTVTYVLSVSPDEEFTMTVDSVEHTEAQDR